MHDITFINNPNLAIREGSGSVELAVSRLQHGLAPAEVDYSTSPLSGAQPGADYMDKSGTLTLEPIDTAQVFVEVMDDTEVEGVETFRFTLDAARGGTVLRHPTSAVVTIVDNDGPARISFATDQFSTYENRGGFVITLVRSGADIAGEATVTLTSTDGTAQAGSDFEEVDVPVTFAANEFRKTVQIRVINDQIAEDTETFTLQISSPDGAELADPQSATVEILDDDSQSSDSIAPISQFHIPMHGKSYSPASAREIHLFSSDEASGVAKIWLGLRKKLRDGKCAWWTGKRFKRSTCSTRRWIDLGKVPANNFMIYRLKSKLKATSTKTGIKNYTAYGRARDEAGNLERSLRKGRNRNTYKIKA